MAHHNVVKLMAMVKKPMRITRATLGLLFLGATASALAFSPSREAVQHAVNIDTYPRVRSSAAGRPSASLRMQGGSASGETASRQVPEVIRILNVSTKWLVTLGNTIGVWSRPGKYYGPFVVTGAILSVYITDGVLKKIINQNRPTDSPLLDPGMPSTHSLVSFFLAAGWVASLAAHDTAIAVAGKAVVVAAAASVAWLRVLCRYHTYAQVGVGAVLGSAMGRAWWRLGGVMQEINPHALFYGAWGAYIAGSALFIGTNMSKWHERDKHL
mmetsp:Transcript_13355/g.28902  ORF Transcript_13355/g.28902 Transcript_13355/m.28902 type:complete len:270 (+) Transcript_13355:24-833(+)